MFNKKYYKALEIIKTEMDNLDEEFDDLNVEAEKLIQQEKYEDLQTNILLRKQMTIERKIIGDIYHHICSELGWPD